MVIINKDFDLLNFNTSKILSNESYSQPAPLIAVESIDPSRYRFYFGPDNLSNLAYLQIRKSHSNIFMTLTDCDGCVIVVKTAATVIGKLERRRRRKAPQTIENMIASLDRFFLKFSITKLKIVLLIRPGQYLNNIVTSLKSRHIFIKAIYLNRKIPFSFTRGRKRIKNK